MRYIEDYSNAYIENYEFEKYKVYYRRKKILEIGCGLEPLFLYVNDDKEFTIVEPSEQFYNHAKKLSTYYKNVTCIKGFFEEEAEKLAEKYDMIICSSLLHEVSAPHELLEAIKTVCNKDTVIHINVPNAYSMHRLLGVEIDILHDIHDKTENNIVMQQNTNFDMKKLKFVVENEEMEIIEEGSFFIKPFSHRQMQEMMHRHIIDERVLDGLYRMSKYMPEFGSEIYVNCKIQ